MRTNAAPDRIVGTPPTREVIEHDPRRSTRWHQHDYPSPIARWNFHPEYEIHLIRHTSGSYVIGDSVGRFEPGQLFLVGPDLPHDWVSDLAPGEVAVGRDVVLQFHDDWVRQCQAVLPELSDLDLLLANSTRGIEFLGETAVEGARLLELIGRTEGAARVSCTFDLLGLLAHAPEEERRSVANVWVPAAADPGIAEAVSRTIGYIFDNLTGDVRLSVAAEMIGMSPSAFSRFFKVSSGHTFSDMVRRLRLAQACKLLDTTTSPVTDVASASGYRNLSNFNRQFKAELGLTPLQYRKQRG
ncbi:AraC family transcriptional regulator [Nocardioides sp. NPDC023903]|uniref:AraC family transcriptional regulator n=1 Tax=Nocardioides sp. NPDC023903 TaxID=3157195 RepID=UPI0033E32B36